MNNRKWMAWFWPAWLIFLIVTFSVPEWYAIAHNGMTLSEWVWRATQAWGPLPYICGMIAGGLAVHFWWTNQGLKK